MIRLLQGAVHSTSERSLILFVNGVGYQVFVPATLLAECPEELTLHIHSHVREDAFTLYGFRSPKELSFFELLLSINGVGPKMALEILNQPADHMQNAIAAGDIATLTRIKGLGKKTAERIVLELKGKVDVSQLSATSSSAIRQVDDEVILVLESLGYKRSHIQNVLSRIEEDIQSTEELVRVFLRQA